MLSHSFGCLATDGWSRRDGTHGRLLAVGISHRTAPLEVRERATLGEAARRTLLATLTRTAAEAVLLQTCNRTELYLARGESLDPGRVLCALAEVIDTPVAQLASMSYLHRERRAARHLFRVAAGLDSRVLGECEIQGQVRAAWRRAREEGRSGPALDRLFRQALVVGKRVRRETRIGVGPRTLPTAAARLAGAGVSSRVVVVGAGTVGERVARAVASAGVAELVVANRTLEPATRIAAALGGRGTVLERLPAELRLADAAICCTGSPGRVVSRRDAEAAMARRLHRPLILVDLAVPRDVDPAAARLPGIELHDLAGLERLLAESLDDRRREAAHAERLVRAEARRFDLSPAPPPPSARPLGNPGKPLVAPASP